MSIALFAGSFDPFTYGHLDTIERSAPLFDHLIVAMASNSSKTRLFSFEEMEKLIKKEIDHLPNVSLQQFNDQLTVQAAKSLNVDVLIRGVRNLADFEYETAIAQMNKYLEEDIETLLMFANPKFSYVSSSLIKEVCQFGGDVSEFVPPQIAQALKKKYSQKRQ